MTISDSPDLPRIGPAAAISGAALRIQTRSACFCATCDFRCETLLSSRSMTMSTNRIAAIRPTSSVRRSRSDSDRMEEGSARARAMSDPVGHLDAALVGGAGRIARDQARLPALLL